MTPTALKYCHRLQRAYQARTKWNKVLNSDFLKGWGEERLEQERNRGRHPHFDPLVNPDCAFRT